MGSPLWSPLLCLAGWGWQQCAQGDGLGEQPGWGQIALHPYCSHWRDPSSCLGEGRWAQEGPKDSVGITHVLMGEKQGVEPVDRRWDRQCYCRGQGAQ